MNIARRVFWEHFFKLTGTAILEFPKSTNVYERKINPTWPPPHLFKITHTRHKLYASKNPCECCSAKSLRKQTCWCSPDNFLQHFLSANNERRRSLFSHFSNSESTYFNIFYLSISLTNTPIWKIHIKKLHIEQHKKSLCDTSSTWQIAFVKIEEEFSTVF